MAEYRPVRAQGIEVSNFTQHETTPRAFVTKRGLQLPRQMPFDTWMVVGNYLSSIFSSSAWCLGDWLVYGEATFSGRYRDAIELTSLDYQTLRNYAWVARRFPMSRRREALSFTHHAEVAALAEPEQNFWLRKADELRWSVKRLRREVKASMLERCTDNDPVLGDGQCGEPVAALPPGDTEDTVLLKVPISADLLESCHAVATRLGLNVERWASQILVEAAAHQNVS
jgi:hypothetical protein